MTDSEIVEKIREWLATEAGLATNREFVLVVENHDAPDVLDGEDYLFGKACEDVTGLSSMAELARMVVKLIDESPKGEK